MNDLINDYSLLIQDSTSAVKGIFGYDQLTSSGNIVLRDAIGNFLVANDGELNVNGNVVYVDSDSLNLGTLTNNPLFRLNIESEDSVNPLSIHENRVGGALNGDNNSIDFYYNDSLGAKTLGGQIQTIVSTPSPGNVNMSMVLNNVFKIQNTGRVLLTPVALTLAAVAQFEVRGTASTTNIVALFKAGGNTNAKIPLSLQNLAGNNLMYVDATAKHFHNPSQLATGDFQMYSDTDIYNFYSNAGTNNVGIGTNNPNASAKLEVNSTTKGFRIAPMTSAQASAITPTEGLMVFTSDTDATFTSVGFWGYEGGSWNKL